VSFKPQNIPNVVRETLNTCHLETKGNALIVTTYWENICNPGKGVRLDG